MDIKIGGYKVYLTGIVVGIIDEPIVFEIQDISFVIEFKNDTQNPNQRFSGVTDDKKKLVLTFFNFNSANGAGNAQPLKVGFLSNKIDLFLNYRIYSLNNELGKSFEYTWLTKDKEDK